jgi:hypothetical protein
VCHAIELSLDLEEQGVNEFKWIKWDNILKRTPGDVLTTLMWELSEVGSWVRRILSFRHTQWKMCEVDTW